MNIASQKSHIAVYHSGIYVDKELLNWFTKEYKARCTGRPNMGKSCIRFKKPEQIPFDLIGELMQKMTVDQWIEIYEQNIRR